MPCSLGSSNEEKVIQLPNEGPARMDNSGCMLQDFGNGLFSA